MLDRVGFSNQPPSCSDSSAQGVRLDGVAHAPPGRAVLRGESLLYGAAREIRRTQRPGMKWYWNVVAIIEGKWPELRCVSGAFPNRAAAAFCCSDRCGLRHRRGLDLQPARSSRKGLRVTRFCNAYDHSLSGWGFKLKAVRTGKRRSSVPFFSVRMASRVSVIRSMHYHPDWRCGLEIEAGRAWMGNAVYRDLIQALVMVQIGHLVLAIPNSC
jgi:hypothetical protein